MRVIRHYICVVLIALSFATSRSSAANAIIDGTEVPRDHVIAKSTVLIRMQQLDREPPYGMLAQSCSGSLIEREIVLTAAHCIGRGMNVFFVDQRPGSGVFRTPPHREVKAYRVHPQYTGKLGDSFLTRVPIDHDLAILRLNKEAAPYYEPAPLLPLSEPLPVGTTVIAAGYGTNQQYGTLRGVGTLRQIQLQVQPSIPSREVAVSAENGSGICSGDSGGPLFLADAEGNLRLWGVSSRVTEKCKGYGFIDRFANHAEWIQEAIRQLRAESAL